MSIQQRLPKNSGLMILSLSLAIVLWLFVSYDKDSEIEMMIPVQLANLPPGLTVVNKPTPRLNMRIAGSRLQLIRLRPEKLKVSLDLKNVNEGTVAFAELDKAIRLHRELRVTRVYPSVIEVKLERVK